MKNNWNGLVKILEIQHVRDNKVIWEDKNILNTLHTQAEMFILSCVFATDPGTFPPSSYYFGLDARTEITVDDLMTDVLDEPSGNGYFRQEVSSLGDFVIDTLEGIYRATGPIITFTATGAGWGPINNLFLTTSFDNSGILIASNPLSNAITLVSGDSVNMRMALALKDVPS